MTDPDFWFLLDWDYNVIVFPTAEEANEAAKGTDMMVFGGRYGKQFSGWVGRQGEAEE
jgi:hypothetical protein